VPAANAAEPAPLSDLVKLVNIPHQDFTLKNGLRVIVHTDRKAPVVAVSVWYGVGSKHEPKGKTGFAHLFEHLMFNGSENAPGDYFEPLQQVGATDFNGTTWDLARLIAAVAEIGGVERIRYTTSHPRDMNDDLIAAHGSISKLMPFLHLPVQSGSDRILELMNRKHTGEFYLDIIARLRKARPDIAFSSDFIVGFPGETDADHEATMEMVRQVRYASCYSFKYSPRPGTPGAVMTGMVPEKLKDERLYALQALLMQQQREYNESFVGTVQPVLFDRRGNKGNGQLLGKSPYMQSVYVDGAPERLFGQTVNVKIEKGFQNGMSGTIDIIDTNDTPNCDNNKNNNPTHNKKAEAA
jgi:hypothetical protein